MPWLNPRSRFKISGGRGGIIHFPDPGGDAQLEWEMLVGEHDMIIYGQSFERSVTGERDISPADLRAIAQDFSQDSGARVLLGHRDGTFETILPTAKS